MNRKQRKYVEALERRAEFLRARIEGYDGRGNPSRDKVERSALLWALEVIKEGENNGLDRGR